MTPTPETQMGERTHTAEGVGGVRLPRQGSRLRSILEGLPATNAEIGDAYGMHSGEVARTMAHLRNEGLVSNGNPGRGRRATYALTRAAEAALSKAESL